MEMLLVQCPEKVASVISFYGNNSLTFVIICIKLFAKVKSSDFLQLGWLPRNLK